MSKRSPKHPCKNTRNPSTHNALTAAFIRAFPPGIDTLGKDLSNEEIDRLTLEKIATIHKGGSHETD